MPSASNHVDHCEKNQTMQNTFVREIDCSRQKKIDVTLVAEALEKEGCPCNNSSLMTIGNELNPSNQKTGSFEEIEKTLEKSNGNVKSSDVSNDSVDITHSFEIIYETTSNNIDSNDFYTALEPDSKTVSETNKSYIRSNFFKPKSMVKFNNESDVGSLNDNMKEKEDKHNQNASPKNTVGLKSSSDALFENRPINSENKISFVNSSSSVNESLSEHPKKEIEYRSFEGN